MKKTLCLFTILFMIAFASIALAIDVWYPANQRTLAWDPVTMADDGSSITGVSYKCYYKAPGGIAGSEVLAGETTEVQYTFTFLAEGQYVLGVKSIRKDTQGVVLSESATVSWSDDPTVTQAGKSFGVTHYKTPGQVKGLR